MKFNIPNIRQMILGTRLGYDQFLQLYGIKKVLRATPPSFEKGQNRKLERYLAKQQIRLVAMREDPMRFWKLANTLLRRSKAFRLLGLRNVRPNWFKDQEMKTVLQWITELDRICKSEMESFEVKRTPIPKPDGSKRYINDPGVPNRIYLWMLNMMLHYWTETRLSDHQHGHRKGRGTLSAWKDIGRLLNSKYIYEFDYKKFHDQIDRKVILLALLRLEIPEEMSIRLTHLCSAYTTKVDESDPLWSEFVTEGRYKHFYRGVVQGSNIAGLIGLAVLEYLEVYDLKKGTYIGYADDGLLFSEDASVREEWKSKLSPEAGVTDKPAKSGWVKKDGQWLKELEFVGLAYDGIRNVVRANTHSGKVAEMKWDMEELNSFIVDKVIPYKSQKPPKTLDFWSGQAYLGLLMSEVWKTTSDEIKGSAPSWVPKSLYEEMRKKFLMSKATASSYAYYMIQRLLNTDPWKPNRYGWVKPPEKVEVDLGGFIYYSKRRTQIQSIKLKDGRDLVPTSSKKPTPRVVLHRNLGTKPNIPQFWNHK